MNGYTLTLHAYCGMARPIGGAGMDEADARQAAARLLRRRRREDFPITVIKERRRREVAEPSFNCRLISRPNPHEALHELTLKKQKCDHQWRR
jgi:hypothetical protein